MLSILNTLYMTHNVRKGKFEDVKAKLNNLETILNEISSDLIKTYLNDFVRLTYTSVEENLFDVRICIL